MTDRETPDPVRPRVALRPVTPEDRGLLLAVYAASRAAELALTDWTDEQKRAFVAMQFDAQDRFYREQYPTATFDVVTVDGEPAGRLYVDRWPSQIRLMDIAILPAFQRRGIGATLIRELQGEAAAAGKALTIHVERMNPALRLYERLGFRVLEDKGVYLLLEWRPESR